MSSRTVDGTAKTSNNDYIAKTGTLTFAPGETTITIEVKGDSRMSDESRVTSGEPRSLPRPIRA